MPREGSTYRIDDAWRSRAEERLVELGWTRARLARESGCSRSLVTELLDGKKQQTTYLPEMHGALGWPPPLPPIASKDAGEMLYLWERLDETQRVRLLERARVMFEDLAKKPK